VKDVVSPGGVFDSGLQVIKKLRCLAKYFCTGQRKHKLQESQERYSLPKGFPHIDELT
jgi:hypothetical protein